MHHRARAAAVGAITSSIEIEDEGDLYANLPLGAASLSGRIEGGESLHLRYFVSGVATATRDAIAKKAVAVNGRCAGATHFVYAYNTGAFELSSSQHDKVCGHRRRQDRRRRLAVARGVVAQARREARHLRGA